jgi:hypothetical protein
MRPIPNDELEDMNQILHEQGYAIEDFEASVEEDPPPVQGPISYWVNQTVTVHRKSNDTTGQFRDESGQPMWLIAFERRLVAGFFGKP